jgi:hypothetical protein
MTAIAILLETPLAPGFVTVMFPTVGFARSAAVRVTVIDVPLTSDELRSWPFHWTVAPVRKFVPVIVTVVAAEPAVMEPGLRPVITGAGSRT